MKNASSPPATHPPKSGPADVPASELKNAWHRWLDRVEQGREEIVVTRYGRPVARLVPYREEGAEPSIVGFLKGTVTVHGDIVGPDRRGLGGRCLSVPRRCSSTRTSGSGPFRETGRGSRAPPSRRSRRASHSGSVLVSAISVWEIAMLEALGRISLARSADEWVRAALRAPGTRLLQLAPEISVESTRLPDDPPRDSADRILIASARITGARLATCDAAIVGYASTGHLEVIDARP